MSVAVRVWDPRVAAVFCRHREEWGELGNTYPARMEVCGARWPAAEAVYQALKLTEPRLQRRVARARSGLEAKREAYRHPQALRGDLDEPTRIRLMRITLRLRACQDGVFRRSLLATGQRPIVERSGRDGWWGAVPQADGTLVGRNVLGRLLMELRAELRAGRVRWPGEPQEFLLGRPLRPPKPPAPGTGKEAT